MARSAYLNLLRCACVAADLIGGIRSADPDAYSHADGVEFMLKRAIEEAREEIEQCAKELSEQA